MRFRLNESYQGELPATLYVKGQTFQTDLQGVIDVPPEIGKLLMHMKEYSPERKDNLSISDIATATVKKRNT